MSNKSLLESEKALFKCLLENPKLVYEIDEDWFCDYQSKLLYNTIRKLDSESKTVSPENIFIESDSDEIKYILDNEILPSEYKITDFDIYLKRIKEEYVKSDINQFVNDELNILVNERGSLNIKRLEELHSKIRIDLDLIDSHNTLDTLSEIGNRYRKELIDRKEGKFYSYGDRALDDITTGAIPGEMTCLFGPSSSGKSTVALNLFNKEINKGIPTAYFTLEMSEISTMDRLIALRTGLSISELMMRNLDYEDKESRCQEIIKIYDREYAKLKNVQNRAFIIDNPGMKLNILENTILKLQEKMNQKYMICIIDLWTMISDVGTEAYRIEQAINKTSDIAKRTGTHLILVVQANRSIDDKTFTSPDQIDSCKPLQYNKIKNSGAIYERVRICLSVWRPKRLYDIYFPDLSEDIDDIIEVIDLKASNGKPGQSVKYLYQPECFKMLPFKED